MKKFKSSFNVYYEDTDAGGVVYYANYLKFIERARTDAIASVNFTNSNLKENYGIYIIVKSCNLNFIKPSKLEDKLDIFSEITDLKNVSIKMKQDILMFHHNPHLYLYLHSKNTFLILAWMIAPTHIRQGSRVV